MVKAPMRVKCFSYRGSDPKKQARIRELHRAGSLLEKHINDLVAQQENPIANYMYHELASDTDVPEDVVAELCFGIDGGSHGFTVVRSDLTGKEASELVYSE